MLFLCDIEAKRPQKFNRIIIQMKNIEGQNQTQLNLIEKYINIKIALKILIFKFHDLFATKA